MMQQNIRYFLVTVCVLFFSSINRICAQGFNHTWLFGATNVLDTNTTSIRAKLDFNINSDTVIAENTKMGFRGTQATISDANGNFLFASNGCWIQDASRDTMQNGNGLNPGTFANSYCTNSTGMPMSNGNLIIPYPGDSSKWVLFHQIGNFNAGLKSTEVFYTVIDMTLNGGLGGVVSSQKNLIAFSDTLSWGLAACKHANGRDWWIVAERDSLSKIFKILFTPNGVASVTSQNLNMPLPFYDNAGQPTFSPDGSKFAYTSGHLGVTPYYDVRIFSFDRCTGMFDSIGYINNQGVAGFALAFSSNSKYLYHASGGVIHQVNMDAANIAASDSIVAIYDGYCYPFPNSCTTFWLMYLAANGKIYITSGNATIDLNVINLPDSEGIACSVQQHSLHLPCFQVRQGLNHPNYYLGRLQGSPCDTLQWSGIKEPENDFRFRVYPNPVTSNILSIGYLLPQNKSGLFQIIDVTGKVVFKYVLPQWSNEQSFQLPTLANGVYNCIINTDTQIVSKTIAIIKQ